MKVDGAFERLPRPVWQWAQVGPELPIGTDALS
jgi:hypothetical protein